MKEFIEKGKRPDNVNPSYVLCPKCGAQLDCWQTAANTGIEERNVIVCFNPECGHRFEVKGRGEWLEVIK